MLSFECLIGTRQTENRWDLRVQPPPWAGTGYRSANNHGRLVQRRSGEDSLIHRWIDQGMTDRRVTGALIAATGCRAT